jgi:hypothetical protein
MKIFFTSVQEYRRELNVPAFFYPNPRNRQKRFIKSILSAIPQPQRFAHPLLAKEGTKWVCWTALLFPSFFVYLLI